jgi:biotin operon repressor
MIDSSPSPGPPAESFEPMVAFFKALSDPTRLRIVGLLSERNLCGQEIATALRLTNATVSHHVRLLRETGLVAEERRPPFTVYRLEMGMLTKTLRSVARKEQVTTFAPVHASTPAEERRVLNNFFEGDRLKAIPAQRSKKEIVFEEILRRLPRRSEYVEKDLNRLIEAIHPDFCTIRREFIMGRYMERENCVYHLTEKGRRVVARGGR